MKLIRQIDIEHYLITGLSLSIVLHIFLGFSLARNHSQVKILPTYLEAVIIPNLSQVAKQQIVSPSEVQENSLPEKSRLLSDKNSSVQKESIRRGSPDSAPNKQNTSTQQSPHKVTTKTNPNNKKVGQELNKPIKKLDLRTDYSFLEKLNKKPLIKNNPLTNQSVQDLKPFSRAPGSQALFLGFSGSNDFLPNVQDGDLTLLNAKADKYAVFVRRVATRVFNLLKQYGWNYLRNQDFSSLKNFTQIRAVLNPKGDFLRLEFIETSGNQQFDTIVKRSISEGANDPNPPVSAKASDGNYRFIFMARCWSEIGGQAGTRSFGERRWLLLKTGLE